MKHRDQLDDTHTEGHVRTVCTRCKLIDAPARRGPAPIAQLVELRTFNPQVPGSSPGGGTILTIRRGPVPS